MSGRKGALAAALFVAAVLASACGNGEEAEFTPAAESPYHQVRPPEEFLAIVDPEGEFAAEDGFWPGLPPFGETEYLAALNKLRADGFEALSEEETGIVLAVSHLAFLAQAETLRYRGGIVDDAGLPIGDNWSLERRNRIERIHGVLYPLLVARHKVAPQVQWGVMPLLDPEAGDETFEFYSYKKEPVAEFTVASFSFWERKGEDWTCLRGGEFPELGFESLGTAFMLECLVSHSIPQGASIVDRRPAYEMTTRCLSQDDPQGEAQRYWLDEETLLPRQWEYEDAGQTIRVTVEEVNGEVDIQVPNVDVACTEADF
jgi:hypothetical protein